MLKNTKNDYAKENLPLEKVKLNSRPQYIPFDLRISFQSFHVIAAISKKRPPWLKTQMHTAAAWLLRMFILRYPKRTNSVWSSYHLLIFKHWFCSTTKKLNFFAHVCITVHTKSAATINIYVMSKQKSKTD